jgi:hypothetical protein
MVPVIDNARGDYSGVPAARRRSPLPQGAITREQAALSDACRSGLDAVQPAHLVQEQRLEAIETE